MNGFELILPFLRPIQHLILDPDSSEIMVNGQKATITELKPGMTVSVTIGVDPTQASRVVATGVPEGRKKKREK